MPIAEAVAVWLATEVVAQDVFERAVDALRSKSEIRVLTTAARRETGIRPGRAYRRWLEADDTWADLVARTEDAYKRLVASLASERSRRLLLPDRTMDDVSAAKLVDATLRHFVASLRPSLAIAVVGFRVDAGLDEVAGRLDEISARLDERRQVETHLSRLPPGVRRIVGLTEHRDYAGHLLAGVGPEDPRAAVEGLVRVPPPWLQNAPPIIQLAVAELCESYGLGMEAAEYFIAAADRGLDRPFLYARAAKAALLGGADDRCQLLLERARAAGGGPEVEMIGAALAEDFNGILAAMSERDALARPALAILYGVALRVSGQTQRAVTFLSEALTAWPDFSGAALELAWVLLGRSQGTATTSRSIDRARAIELALLVRQQRREWGGDASEAVRVACMAAMANSDFRLALRLGSLPPDGEANPIEADHPEVRYSVFQASLAVGDVDRARAIAESAPDGFQAALLSAEILTTVSGARDEVVEAFWNSWRLATRDEDRVAVWFGAAQAGIEPLPGQAELDQRTDHVPILVASQRDIASGNFAEAAKRLRLRPDSESCVRLLSHALTQGGLLDEAVSELEIAAQRFDNPDHMHAAARLLVEAGRLGDATTMADRALVQLPGSLGTQRAFCHQVGLREAQQRGAWREMAARIRAWIDDQGGSLERRWLLVQALHDDGAFDEAWAVMNDVPALEPDGALTAQLWISLCARFRPSAELPAEILDVHDRFAADDAGVTRAAVNAVVNMGTATGEMDSRTQGRYQALLQRREEAAATPGSDDTFFSVKVPDTVDEFVESFRPHLEPRAQRLEAVQERVAFGLPYGLLSATAGRSYTAALIQRGAGCLPIEERDPARVVTEINAARSALGNPVVVDLSTICCAWYLRDLWPLIRSGVTRLELPSPARRDAVAAVDGLTPRPSGYVSWDTRTGRPVISEADPADIERIETHTAWVADTLSQATIREWPFLLSRPFAIHDSPLVMPWLAAADLAKQRELSLWADDVGLRSVARDAGVPTFGTVALLAALEERGDLSALQRRTATRALRDEYCVDLELDIEWMEHSAALAQWRGGPAALNFSRPALWANDVDATFTAWKQIVEAVVDVDAGLISSWVYAAATGICRAVPRSRSSAVVASLIGTGVVAADFQRAVFGSCLESARQACHDLGAEDPLQETLSLFFDVLSAELGPAAAASM